MPETDNPLGGVASDIDQLFTRELTVDEREVGAPYQPPLRRALFQHFALVRAPEFRWCHAVVIDEDSRRRIDGRR